MTPRSRAEIARIRNSEPQDSGFNHHPDPDSTYDESTNPSNGWRSEGSMPDYATVQQADEHSETSYPWFGSPTKAEARQLELLALGEPSAPEGEELQALNAYLWELHDQAYEAGTASELGPNYHDLAPRKHGPSYDHHLDPSYHSHQARQEFRRRTGKAFYPGSTSDQATLDYLQQELRLNSQVPEIPLTELGELVVIPSGSAPQLPYPAARISTVSGVVVLNTSLVNRLRDQFQGRVPDFCSVQIPKDDTQLKLILEFHSDYRRGCHKLGSSTDYNRGYSVHCSRAIQRLVARAEALGDISPAPDHWPTGQKRSHYDQQRQAAADLVFGRRRLLPVAGSPYWVLNCQSELV